MLFQVKGLIFCLPPSAIAKSWGWPAWGHNLWGREIQVLVGGGCDILSCPSQLLLPAFWSWHFCRLLALLGQCTQTMPGWGWWGQAHPGGFRGQNRVTWWMGERPQQRKEVEGLTFCNFSISKNKATSTIWFEPMFRPMHHGLFHLVSEKEGVNFSSVFRSFLDQQWHWITLERWQLQFRRFNFGKMCSLLRAQEQSHKKLTRQSNKQWFMWVHSGSFRWSNKVENDSALPWLQVWLASEVSGQLALPLLCGRTGPGQRGVLLEAQGR